MVLPSCAGALDWESDQAKSPGGERSASRLISGWGGGGKLTAGHPPPPLLGSHDSSQRAVSPLWRPGHGSYWGGCTVLRWGTLCDCGRWVTGSAVPGLLRGPGGVSYGAGKFQPPGCLPKRGWSGRETPESKPAFPGRGPQGVRGFFDPNQIPVSPAAPCCASVHSGLEARRLGLL